MVFQQGQQQLQLPPLRTFEIVLMDPLILGSPGASEGLEGHRMFVDESGALVVTRLIIAPWMQGGVADQYLKTYAPGTWYTGADKSGDFKTMAPGGVSFQ